VTVKEQLERLGQEMQAALEEAKQLRFDCNEAVEECRDLVGECVEVRLIELSDLRDSFQDMKDSLQESDNRLDSLLKELEAKVLQQ
jgi:hypothetical protein